MLRQSKWMKFTNTQYVQNISCTEKYFNYICVRSTELRLLKMLRKVCLTNICLKYFVNFKFLLICINDSKMYLESLNVHRKINREKSYSLQRWIFIQLFEGWYLTLWVLLSTLQKLNFTFLALKNDLPFKGWVEIPSYNFCCYVYHI